MIIDQSVIKDKKTYKGSLSVGIRIVSTSKKNNKYSDFIMFAIDEDCPPHAVMGETKEHGIPDLEGYIYVLPQSAFKEEINSPPFFNRFDLTIPGIFGFNLVEEILRLSEGYYFDAAIHYTQTDIFHSSRLKRLSGDKKKTTLSFLEPMSIGQ